MARRELLHNRGGKSLSANILTGHFLNDRLDAGRCQATAGRRRRLHHMENLLLTIGILDHDADRFVLVGHPGGPWQTTAPCWERGKPSLLVSTRPGGKIRPNSQITFPKPHHGNFKTPSTHKTECSKWRSAKSAPRVGPIFQWAFPRLNRDRFPHFQRPLKEKNPHYRRALFRSR